MFHLILALTAVALLAWRPRSAAAAAALVALAAIDVCLGAPLDPLASVVAPLVAFLGAALTLAGVVESSGLARRAAFVLAAAARGSTIALFASVCVCCAALTAAVSLDGAVVLMVPLLIVLSRSFGAPLRPLFLGVVAVANAVSLAVPQGNPTNLVLIDQLRLSPTAFVAHMFLPGLAAAVLCAVAVAVSERRRLAGSYAAPSRQRRRGPLSRGEAHAGLSLLIAAGAAFAAPLFGVAPWWPFAGAVALTLGLRGTRSRVVVPWRIAAQVGSLLVVIGAVGLAPPVLPLGLGGLLVVAAIVGAAAAVVNNLPVSVWAASLLAGPAGYAASIGLALGSLATPQGSVATLIATDLAGEAAPSFPLIRFVAISVGSLLVATLLLWAGL